MQAFAKVSH